MEQCTQPMSEEILVQEFEKHYKKLFGVVYRMTENVHDAEDVLQNVFIKAYKSCRSFRGEAKLSTWLYRIAINESSTYMKIWYKLPLVTITEEKKCSEEDFLNSLAYEPKESDHLYIEELREKCLRGFLRCVPKHMRIAYLLKTCLNMKNKEIADVMEITENNVKIILHRARIQLQEMFACRCSLIDPEKPCKCFLWIKFMQDNNLPIPNEGINYKDASLEQEHFRNLKLMHKIEFLYRVEHQYTYTQFIQKLKTVKEIL